MSMKANLATFRAFTLLLTVPTAKVGCFDDFVIVCNRLLLHESSFICITTESFLSFGARFDNFNRLSVCPVARRHENYRNLCLHVPAVECVVAHLHVAMNGCGKRFVNTQVKIVR